MNIKYYDDKIEVSTTEVSREEIEELKEYLREKDWYWREKKKIR